MKVRNIVRRVAVLGSAVAMVGATIMGAMAYDLADYPDRYIVDGQFDGKIVVGARAATTDVLGAIDIAASLQAGAVSEEEVNIPGRAGEVSLTGDAFRLETSSDLLELREVVGAVYDTLTESDLSALRGGSITTDEGSTDYFQYLRFADSNATTQELQPMAVNYAEDEDDALADYLVIDDNAPFFEWEIEFTEGLESSTTDGQLDDLEDEVFNIFGTDFTFVDSSLDTTGSRGNLVLEFMAGDVSDTLREGETKTYTIDGVDYEVTSVFISDPSSAGNPEAKFAVNGELTDGLADGDTDTLSNGLQIGVRDLLVNSREGIVEFFLGANKIQFTDATTTGGTAFDGDVEIANENIEDATVSIVGSYTSSDNTTYEITNIKYRLSADASVGSTIYVPAGMGVREFLDEPEGLLSPTFDITYEGLKDVESTEVSLKARSDHSYDMIMTNLRGKEYDVPVLTNQDGTFKWGDDDDDFWFKEPAAPTGGNTNASATDFFIGDDDYFVVSEAAVTSADEKTDSAIMRYDDIDTSDRLLTFTDLSTGESREVSYQTCSGGAGSCGEDGLEIIGIASNFVVEGNTYTIWVGNSTLNSLVYPLLIDLDGSESIDGAEVGFTVKGGGVLDFGTQTAGSSGVGAATVTMSLSTPQDQFDDSTLGGDSLSWIVENRTGNEIGIQSGVTYAGPLEHGGNDPWGDFNFVNDDNDDDYNRGLTDYGAVVELYDPTGSNDAEEFTIMYPETQVGAQVFVVAGVTERTTSGTGAIVTDVVNPIAVGLAVLDSDAPALGRENMIVVGGPCANTVAASFMGNPANCAEGFEAGKAMIASKEYGSTVAILVAGYSAQDTLGASYVLADYDTYLADAGSEVEVVSSDLSDLRVMSS